MRIFELTGYKKDPLYNILQNSTSAEELQDNLEANGFKQYVIGTGLYSSVLGRPDLDYVVKIFKNDPGYETYLKYIIKYQNNPHVPKLRGKPISVGTGFKVVRLEKLKPMNNKNRQDMAYFDLISDYVSENKANVDQVKQQFPQILPVLDDIMTHSGTDIHDENIMFRGAVPVITDPLSGFSTR